MKTMSPDLFFLLNKELREIEQMSQKPHGGLRLMRRLMRDRSMSLSRTFRRGERGIKKRYREIRITKKEVKKK